MIHIKNIPAIILLLSTLTACKVTRDVATPNAPLPQSFRNNVTTDTTSIADLQWNNFFVDTSLQKLINSAIANNYDMQLALKNMEGAQLLLSQTKWAYLPNAALQVTANSNRPSDNSLNGLSAKSFLGTTHVEDFSANVALSWEADIWGKIKNQRAGSISHLSANRRSQEMDTNQHCSQCI